MWRLIAVPFSASIQVRYQLLIPSGGATCSNPGTNPSDGEADLDAEIASAIAPNASIVVATCADSGTTNGVLFAAENLLNSTTPPAIMSMSYGECEAVSGACSSRHSIGL